MASNRSSKPLQRESKSSFQAGNLGQPTRGEDDHGIQTSTSKELVGSSMKLNDIDVDKSQDILEIGFCESNAIPVKTW
jgi:hypothetical protein